MSTRCTSVGIALLAGALALGGCGREEEPRAYRLEPTRACLAETDVPVTTRNVDFVASTALGGALKAKFPENQVTIAFGRSGADAERTERAYRNFAPKKLKIDDVLRRDANVVLLWAVGPSERDAETVTDCLRS